MRIGILALQGAVQPHVEKLGQLGVKTQLVKHKQDLENLSGVILPGGESTTMLHLLEVNDLFSALGDFIRERPSWGLCAGTILLSKEVLSKDVLSRNGLSSNVAGPSQRSFGTIDMTVDRNAFGRQVDSFIDVLSPEASSMALGIQEAVFIRAPRITRVGAQCEVLYRFQGEPVMVRQKNALASTFHPELSSRSQLHQFFIGMCQNG